LKNESGSVGKGRPTEEPTVTMKMDIKVFNLIMKGEISATQAFMAKKLEIKGNMPKAIQLEGLLNSALKSSK